MSTTELQLSTNLEGRVLRTLQAYFRRANEVLVQESLWANGLDHEHVEEIMSLIKQKQTVAEIMEKLREKGIFNKVTQQSS